MVGIIAALIVALAGGVSVAAQSSLPGSVLYPVKVNINEEVRASFKVSAEARADFAATRAQERLKEAEELSIKKDVDVQTRADIEANFKAFADRAQVRMKALMDTDANAAADVASNFEVALRAHEKVLANLAAAKSDVRTETSGLRTKVASEADEATKVRTDAEAKVRAQGNGPDTKTAAEGKLRAATNVIAAARRFIDTKSAVMTTDEKARAEARLSTASGLVVQGQAKLAAGAYAEAFNLGNTAIRTAQSVHLLLDVESGLNGTLLRDSERPEESDGPKESGRPEVSRSPGASVHGESDIELRLDF